MDENSIDKEGILNRIQNDSQKYMSKLKTQFSSFSTRLDNFLNGEEDLTGYKTNSTNYLLRLGFEDLDEKAEKIFNDLETIALEKWFRAGLLTYNEHEACGSSGYGKYSKFPDTPVCVVMNMLGEEGGIPIGEARRAREIENMTTLNEKGKVTGEKNLNVKDAYHFLSPERKKEVIKLEEQYIKGLEVIFQEDYSMKEELLADFKKFLIDYIKGEHTYNDALPKTLEVKKATKLDFIPILDDARDISYKGGFRDKFLTPQELKFSGRGYDKKYDKNPHTPIGIQDGILTLEQANKFREGEESFNVMTALFSGGYEVPVIFSLEEVGPNKKTVKGPLPMDQRNEKPWDDKTIEFYKTIIKKIPFSRLQDWYHKTD